MTYDMHKQQFCHECKEMKQMSVSLTLVQCVCNIQYKSCLSVSYVNCAANKEINSRLLYGAIMPYIWGFIVYITYLPEDYTGSLYGSEYVNARQAISLIPGPNQKI